MNDNMIRVLLIEDEPDDAFLVRTALDGAVDPAGEFRVAEAGSLEKALAVLHERPFDVALLDLSLPGTSGLDTLAAVRNRFPELPVVVLTGNADERLACAAVERGAQDYLLKGELAPRSLRRALLYAAARGRLAREERRADALFGEVTQQRRRSDLKDRLFSSAAHELRSPVTVVRAALQTLQEGPAGSLGPDQQVLVELALRNTLALGRFLEDALDLSRIEAGVARRRPVEFAPRALLEELARSYALVGNRRGVAVSLEAPEDLPRLNTDPEMFRRVVGNLLDNALRFARSRVRVFVRWAEDFEVYVEDDGPGVSAEAAPALFERWTQADRVPTECGYKGTGLGLSLCREMAALNGGDVALVSEPGEGARFVFSLPDLVGARI